MSLYVLGCCVIVIFSPYSVSSIHVYAVHPTQIMIFGIPGGVWCQINAFDSNLAEQIEILQKYNLRYIYRALYWINGILLRLLIPLASDTIGTRLVN